MRGSRGMRAYSTDLKERLVRAVALRSAHARSRAPFCGGSDHRQTRRGAAARDGFAPRAGPFRAARARSVREHEAVLRARLVAAPDAPRLEALRLVGANTTASRLSEATMWRALRRLGWTHKKRR